MLQAALKELWVFGIRNALSCLFPVVIFSLLALSHFLPAAIPRYDFLLAACIGVQALMVLTGLETKDEVLVIGIFHGLGLLMELYKVRMGSWSYPEAAYTKIAGVPLYSGFMYASVASYMCQAWRRYELTLTRWPAPWVGWALAAAIYVNFFTLHWIPDLRWPLAGLIGVAFWRARVYFTTTQRRHMPVKLSFLLIGFFIWLAENIATFLGAWKYAYQHKAWQMVNVHKVTSWILMAIVSYIIVAQLKQLKYGAKTVRLKSPVE